MYTPSGLARPSHISLELIAAGRRAAARHGVSFTNEPSTNKLHAWDLTLRSEGNELARECLIKQTQSDLHDAAAALDRITGGFTIILHTHGAVVPPTPSSHPTPEQMQFVAYLTRREMEDHAPQFHSPIARIAQVFAAEVMTLHSTNYVARCIASGVDADLAATNLLQLDLSPHALIASPVAQSSQYLFNGYHPGHLEGFLLQERSSHAALKPGLFPLPATFSPKPLMAAPSNKHINVTFPPPYSKPLSSSRAASSSPTRKAAAPPTAAVLEKDMGTLCMSASVNGAPRTISTRPLAKATPVQEWQATVRPQARHSGRPLHLQGSLSVSTRHSVSSTSSFDWDNDGESVLPESVIAAAERQGYDTPRPRSRLVDSEPLTPIISMGTACEAAILKAGLPDTIHLTLRELVRTRVTTLWLASLMGAPLHLSATNAFSMHAALVKDSSKYQ